MLACELDVPAPAVARRALLEQRLIVNATGPTTVRLLPPLIVGEAEIDDALERLGAALAGQDERDRVRRRVRRSSTHDFPPRTASYEADPAEVHRVLLLYSGGLDTSVMLKWIQDEYAAEVVCLTVNLGQPGEDYAVIEDKALRLGALECHVVDAREEFAREYVLPGDQGQRAVRRLPAVHRARPAADRQARGRVRAQDRLRHDRPRLHRQGQRPGADRGDRRDARPRAEGDRAGALLADGPRGGDRLRARARHPDQVLRQGAESRRPTRSTTTSGGAPRRAAGSRISTTRPRTTSSSSSRAPSARPTRPRSWRSSSSGACPSP